MRSEVNADRLIEVLQPACASLGIRVFDVELRPGTVLVTIDRDGSIDLETIAAAARAFSALLDEQESLVPLGSYELEVSSPGVERRLRRPEHFADAIGKRVAVRTVAGTAGDRRLEGEILAADDEGIVVGENGTERRIAYEAIDRVHTIFDWRAALAGSREREAGQQTTSQRPGAVRATADLAERAATS